MFEVQACNGLDYAGYFTTAGTMYRGSGFGLAQWAELASVAGNLDFRLSLLENLDGHFPFSFSIGRVAGYSAVAQFHQFLLMREKNKFAPAIANSRHSVKMSVEFCQNDCRTFCNVFTGESTISYEFSSWKVAFEGACLPEELQSSNSKDERGLKLWR
jgi:hypothetical protein